jgi:GNAT superfamily N-acetyltransferase
MNDYTIRLVTQQEFPIVARHRLRMFQDMGSVPPVIADQLQQSSERALASLLASGEYVGWFAVNASGEVIAGVGAHIKTQLPRVSLVRDEVVDSPVPLVVNVYTEPDWRGRGIARALMRQLMSWAAGQEYDRVVLHASDAGRALYVSLDFASTNEMRWIPS